MVLPPRHNVSSVRVEMGGKLVGVPLRHYEIMDHSPAWMLSGNRTVSRFIGLAAHDRRIER